MTRTRWILLVLTLLVYAGITRWMLIEEQNEEDFSHAVIHFPAVPSFSEIKHLAYGKRHVRQLPDRVFVDDGYNLFVSINAKEGVWACYGTLVLDDDLSYQVGFINCHSAIPRPTDDIINNATPAFSGWYH